MFCGYSFIFVGKFFPEQGKGVNIYYQELYYLVHQVTRLGHLLRAKFYLITLVAVVGWGWGRLGTWEIRG